MVDILGAVAGAVVNNGQAGGVDAGGGADLGGVFSSLLAGFAGGGGGGGAEAAKATDGDGKFDWGEFGHSVLSAAGFIPGWGAIADGANAAWYAAEGNETEAAKSVMAAIPGIGDASALGGIAQVL